MKALVRTGADDVTAPERSGHSHRRPRCFPFVAQVATWSRLLLRLASCPEQKHRSSRRRPTSPGLCWWFVKREAAFSSHLTLACRATHAPALPAPGASLGG